MTMLGVFTRFYSVLVIAARPLWSSLTYTVSQQLLDGCF